MYDSRKAIIYLVGIIIIGCYGVDSYAANTGSISVSTDSTTMKRVPPSPTRIEYRAYIKTEKAPGDTEDPCKLVLSSEGTLHGNKDNRWENYNNPGIGNTSDLDATCPSGYAPVGAHGKWKVGDIVYSLAGWYSLQGIHPTVGVRCCKIEYKWFTRSPY